MVTVNRHKCTLFKDEIKIEISCSFTMFMEKNKIPSIYFYQYWLSITERGTHD